MATRSPNRTAQTSKKHFSQGAGGLRFVTGQKQMGDNESTDRESPLRPITNDLDESLFERAIEATNENEDNVVDVGDQASL